MKQLAQSIDEYIEHHNDGVEEGYRWCASADEIIAKYRSAQPALDMLKTA